MNARISALALGSLIAASWAQDASAQAAYCNDLKRVTALAVLQGRFSSIAGKPREGNFADTTLTLTGWQDCSLYGASTYTCDSPALDSADAAERTQADILNEVKACLGAEWSEAADRSSRNYAVLHHALRPVSITLSTDETADKRHVVHLILFVRRG
jgi:hypothetical protein